MNDDIDEVVSFETIEEAVAELRARLPPDCSVLLHAEDCELDEEEQAGCTCTPILVEHSTGQA